MRSNSHALLVSPKRAVWKAPIDAVAFAVAINRVIAHSSRVPHLKTPS